MLSELNSGINADFAHLIWLLSNGSCHFAVVDSFDAVSSAVEADNQELLVSSFCCADCAKSHFVILSENSLDFRICLENIFSNCQALASVKVCALLSNNLQFIVGNVMEALAAFTCSRCAWNTFQFSNRNTFAKFRNDEVSCHFAAFDVVGSDMSCNFALIGRAVNGDNRNLCLICCDDRVGDGSGVNRVYDEYADVALEQICDIISLLCRVVLSINDFNIDTGFISSGFYAVTEKPIVTFLEPEAAPLDFLSEEPQPATEISAAPIIAAKAIFFNNCLPP